MINCIAIDDEPLALSIIENFCSKIPYLNLQRTFTDTSEAARYLRKFPTDLLFLDIQMPHQSGIDFYKLEGKGKMVIFTTAYSNFAVEGFNLSAMDYLLKPIAFERFLQATDKAYEYYQYQHASGKQEYEYLFVRSDYSLVKIAFNDIEYIETMDDYLRIHIPGKKPLLTKMNLKNVMEKLNPFKFIRVHRSFIVPLEKISSVRGKIIRLGETEIPIGIKFEEEFFKRYTQ